MDIKHKERNLLKAGFEHEEVRKLYVPKDFFIDPVHQLIWNSYVYLNSMLSLEHMAEVFKESKNEIHFHTFVSIIEEYNSSSWKEDYKLLFEEWKKKELVKIGQKILSSEEKSDNIIKKVRESLDKLDPVQNTEVEKHINDVLLNILKRKDGNEPTMIVSGYKAFDNLVKMDFARIALLAGSKKIGKTKFIINYTTNVLTYMKDVGVHMYSFELTYEEVVYEMIAMFTGLTIEQILSKGYKLTAADELLIENATKKISQLDMQIYTDTVSIDDLYEQHIKFASQRKHSIVVIDNIGLLLNKRRNQNENDEYIAKRLVELKKKSKSLIIPIHHMTKDMEKEDRLKSGYRPRLEYLRGSTRIQDFCNMVLLIHRPGHYPDLINKERARGTIKTSKGIYNREELIKKLFIIDTAINRNGGKSIVRFLHRLDRTQFKLFNYNTYE